MEYLGKVIKGMNNNSELINYDQSIFDKVWIHLFSNNFDKV